VIELEEFDIEFH
jgi:ribonuclease HI